MLKQFFSKEEGDMLRSFFTKEEAGQGIVPYALILLLLYIIYLGIRSILNAPIFQH